MSSDEAPESMEPVQNPSAPGALGQGSNIPLGWKPTEAKPVPVVRCVQIKKDGDRCGRWSIRGYTKCYVHAGPGALMPDGNVSRYADSIVEAARLRLIGSTDAALDTIEGLMQPGTGEAIRLKAATEILDRAGVRGGYEVTVDVGDATESPADLLAKRLSKLREGAEALRDLKAEQAVEADADVVDAEVVSDTLDEPHTGAETPDESAGEQ